MRVIGCIPARALPRHRAPRKRGKARRCTTRRSPRHCRGLGSLLHTCATLASLYYAVKPAVDEMTDEERRRWVTSLEVARLAGVSRSAVSRCFTPGASIAERT